MEILATAGGENEMIKGKGNKVEVQAEIGAAIEIKIKMEAGLRSYAGIGKIGSVSGPETGTKGRLKLEVRNWRVD